MSKYDYRALDPHGQEVRGEVEAEDERDARRRLRQQGLTPLQTTANRKATALGSSGKPWPRAGKVLFTRQLSSMLAAGMPLESALTLLIEQADQQTTRSLLLRIRADVAAGKPLSAALAAQSSAFDQTYCALVGVAEQTGRLDSVLEDLAGHLEASDALRQRLIVAMIYPLAILAVAILVIGGLLIHVVPQIVEVFTRQHQTLPLLTRMLIGLSAFIKAAWIPGVLTGGVCMIIGGRILSNPPQRLRLMGAISRLPVLGSLLRLSGTQRLSATLGMALKGGVPMLDALALAGTVLVVPAQRHAVHSLAESISRGASLGAALAVIPGNVFEPALRHFVQLGERNGRLAEMLGEVSRQQRASFEYRLGWITGLIEPALVVMMGAVVLVIVLAVLLPIIEINQFLK